MKKTLLILITLSLITSIAYPAQSIGGFGSDPPWGGPLYPWCEYCHIEGESGWYYEGDNPYLGNVSPAPYSDDVDITDKGIQTCVNLTVPDNCTVNVTFEWLNWSQYFDAWMDWMRAQSWDDWDSINWSTEPTWENDSFWHNYSNWSGVNVSSKLCEYNENATCHTDGDWTTEWFDWRVTINITCPTSTYNATCYYCFQPELCPVSYIYPPSPNGSACPCCVNLCFTVNNTLGRTMNITAYSNLSGTWDYFYLGTDNVTIPNVTNGTYCIMVPYFVIYDHTYYWNVSIDDGHTIYDSNIYSFTTENLENCSCCNECDGVGNRYIIIRGSILGIIGLIGMFGFIGFRFSRKRGSV